MYKEFTLDESILDIDAWLPDKEVDKLINAIIEADDILNNQINNHPLKWAVCLAHS